jgi:hypothetical protein
MNKNKRAKEIYNCLWNIPGLDGDTLKNLKKIAMKTEYDPNKTSAQVMGEILWYYFND